MRGIAFNRPEATNHAKYKVIFPIVIVSGQRFYLEIYVGYWTYAQKLTNIGGKAYK
jgi:hypothetical protein